MKIYVICPVRAVDETQKKICDLYVEGLEDKGHEVFYPHREVNQADPTGFQIICQEYEAMKDCDAVHVIWDVNSYGSHFDLGMAFALGKEIHIELAFEADRPGKSYQKAIMEYMVVKKRAKANGKD